MDRHAGEHLATARAVPGEVLDWRRMVLQEAGSSACLARGLAEDAGCDLHRLLDLVDRGCPPALAVRILAPL